MPEKKKNPGYVTTSECKQISGSINNELETIKKALIGDDMRGGLVKDVADIKLAHSWVTTYLVPIMSSVVTAVITAYVLGILS
jgi:hypothetical protein